MSVELVGTRVDEAAATTALLVERLDEQAGGGVVVVSAYWDASSFSTARDLALRVNGVARMALWIAGGTSQSAWDAVLTDAIGDDHLEVRFVGSPTGGGIFHAKVVAVTDEDQSWSCALVGSANFTTAGQERNVELGVLMRGEEPALDELAAWFDALWQDAMPAHDIDIDEAKSATPIRADDEARRRSTEVLGLVEPVHAGGIVRVPKAVAARKRDAPVSLAACHGNVRRIERYLDVVVGRVAGNGEDARTKHVGQRKYVGTKLKRIHLAYADERVQLRMWPGDTLEQAKPLYEDPSATRGVLTLREHGWEVRPNFHWGYQQGGRGHRWPMPDTLPVDEYAAYWVERITDTWQLKPDGFDEYVERLVEDRVIDAEHRAQFRRIFQTKPLDHATPRPGLAAEFSWTLDEAIRLDTQHELVPAVRERVNEMLRALGEMPLGHTTVEPGTPIASAQRAALVEAVERIETAVADSNWDWGRQIAQSPEAIKRLAQFMTEHPIVEPYVMGFLKYARDKRARQGALQGLRGGQLGQRLREHIMYLAGVDSTRSGYTPQAHPSVIVDLASYLAAEERAR